MQKQKDQTRLKKLFYWLKHLLDVHIKLNVSLIKYKDNLARKPEIKM